ncbi:MAG TPA: FKBP-type peptidyl-prolyl cis-trans isomerase [Bacteroidales bacterium]|nr:FKBP-type peptidyl-prolyl cis-trans isomerase [Bacteroidales bacterium]
MKFPERSNNLISVISILCVIMIHGCRNSESPDNNRKLSAEQLMEINHQLVIKDKERTENYIKRKDLKMEATTSGLWYSVISKGEGEILDEGSEVSLEYVCTLLDGTICYSSETDGLYKVIIGETEIPAGLDEGLRKLTYGSEAFFIIPSYLGYGLMGDGKRIPARAILTYKVKVLE